MTDKLPPDLRTKLAELAAAKEQMVQDALDAGEWERYLDLHGSHECFDAFLGIEQELLGEEYWRLLAKVWVMADVVFPDLPQWRKLFADSEREGRECLMTEAERAGLAALPDIVEVYRGFGNPGGADGIAWTLDRERAAFFARTFPHGRRMKWFGVRATGAWVASAVVPRERIVALFDERKESEVIVPDMTGIQLAIESFEPLPEA